MPNGDLFALSDDKPKVYLHYKTLARDFELGSDAVMQTFTRWESMRAITGDPSLDENEAFRAIGYTIGGMMLFPSNKVDGKITINVARGFNRWTIADRMNLTLECIRRHYLSEWSPLAEVLGRYADFFALFRDFRGYVDFFLLQDLVTDDEVRFFINFEDFRSAAVPRDRDTYLEFRRRSIKFTVARNLRIADTVRGLHESG